MANTIFELDEFKPLQNAWNDRVKTLQERASYYDGSVYAGLALQSWKSLSWFAPRFFQNVRPLYLPVARAVDVDAGIIPGGWELEDEAPGKWRKAMDTLFRWSRWETDGVLYVHYGAQYGLVGLKIAQQAEGRLMLQPIDPTRFMLVPAATYDPSPALAIYIDKRKGGNGKEFEYAEVISKADIRTFKNGQPFGYDDRQAVQPNPFELVPYVEVQHKVTGHPLGECTYSRTIPMLDQVNELASYVAEVIKKHGEPQWAIAGAEPSDLMRSGDKVWFLPQGATPHILLPKVDIEGILGFIREIGANVNASLPELAFDELRKKDAVATATLELQLIELVLKIKRCRPNYDAGLVSAMQIAGKVGGTVGAIELAPLDDEDLMLDNERPVLPMDPKTEMELELQAMALEDAKAGPGEGGEAEPEDEGGGESEPESMMGDQPATGGKMGGKMGGKK